MISAPILLPPDTVPEKAVVYLPFDGKGRTLQNHVLTLERWHTLELVWDLHAKECRLNIDGQPGANLALNAYTSEGVNYLHLRSRATTNDSVGFLIESVKVVIKDGVIPVETNLQKRKR